MAAVSGFGIGSLLTPLLMLSFPAATAVAFVAVPHALATVLRWWRLRADVSGHAFRQFGLASAAGGLAGAVLQARLASPILSIVLGALLVLVGIGELWRRLPAMPRNPLGWATGGVLSGFFGGLVGNQGGIRSAALLGYDLSPREMVATATASALLVDAARLPVYLFTRFDALRPLTMLMVAACVGAVAGTFAGVPILRRIPAPVFRRVLGALLVGLGLLLLITAWVQLQKR